MTIRPAVFFLPLLAAPLSAQAPPGCPLPFAAIARARAVDESCPPEGEADRPARRAQNRVQNEFCAPGPARALTIADFSALHQAMRARDLPWGCANCLPEDRAVYREVGTVAGAPLGEGRLVRLAGYVVDARAAEPGPQQSANCAGESDESRDLLITLGEKRDGAACDGVLAAISPRHRPDAWQRLAQSRALLGGRPVRVTGQLMFDAGHGLCFRGKPTAGNPPRASAWQIGPVYALERCRHPELSRCPAGDDGAWEPLAEPAALNGAEAGLARTAASAPIALSDDTAAVLEAEVAYSGALAAGDRAALESLLAPGFTATDAAGTPQDRAARLAAPPEAASVLAAPTVRFLAPGVAWVTGWRAKPGPKSPGARVRFGDLFVHDGRWRVAASQLTPAAD